MIITLRMMSKFVPGGRKMLRSVDATKSRVISGTPRMNSMKPTHIALTMSMFDWRPRARRIPKGSEHPMATTPIMTESMNPPNFRDSTVSSQNGAVSGEIAARPSPSPAARTSV